MINAYESPADDLHALVTIARASLAVLGRGQMTAGDLRSDVVAMRSILDRIDARLDRESPL